MTEKAIGCEAELLAPLYAHSNDAYSYTFTSPHAFIVLTRSDSCTSCPVQPAANVLQFR